MCITQLTSFFPYLTFPTSLLPLSFLNFTFPIFILVDVINHSTCSWHMMFTFIEVTKFLQRHKFILLISSSTSPHPLLLVTWTPSHLQEIITLSPSTHLILFSFFVLSLDQMRDHLVFKLTCLVHFIQHNSFQLHPFSYKCLKFCSSRRGRNISPSSRFFEFSFD